MSNHTPSTPIHPDVRIGHVHLKVADIERALEFYCGVLGFEVTQRMGSSAAFISAGGYHHHIGLNTWESRGGMPPPPGHTGLYHVAILYPDRASRHRRTIVSHNSPASPWSRSGADGRGRIGTGSLWRSILWLR